MPTSRRGPPRLQRRRHTRGRRPGRGGAWSATRVSRGGAECESAGSTEGPRPQGPRGRGRSRWGEGAGAHAATATGSCGGPCGGAPAAPPPARCSGADRQRAIDRWRIEHFSSFGDFRGFSVNRRPAPPPPARIDLGRRQPSPPAELTAPLRLCTPHPVTLHSAPPTPSHAARERLGAGRRQGCERFRVGGGQAEATGALGGGGQLRALGGPSRARPGWGRRQGRVFAAPRPRLVPAPSPAAASASCGAPLQVSPSSLPPRQSLQRAQVAPEPAPRFLSHTCAGTGVNSLSGKGVPGSLGPAQVTCIK